MQFVRGWDGKVALAMLKEESDDEGCCKAGWKAGASAGGAGTSGGSVLLDRFTMVNEAGVASPRLLTERGQ